MLYHRKQREVVIMDFSSRLKEARERSGYSQKALAAKLFISQQAYAHYETGKSSPNPETLKRIAEVLEVSSDYLLSCDSRGWDEMNSDPTWINVLGRVAAGIPIEAIEEIIDREQISDEMARSGKYIGLQIHGASMEPRMKEGDVVIVRLQDDCESGETVVAIVNGDEATCKILQKTPEGITLMSTNPAYTPMFFSNKDIEEKPVRILGKVVELRAKY